VEIEPCEDADLVVFCGMPGCEILLNGRERYVTNEVGGFTFQVAGNQKYKIRVSKPGYEPWERTADKLDCGDQHEVNAALVARPVTLRIRTAPTECDIYLDRQKQPKGSDSQGLFMYLMAKPNMLIEAKKPGYLSATRNIVLAPEWATREIVLALEPISAQVKLSVNVDGARVTVDNETSSQGAGERLLLRPGPHSITIDALGYSPITFELTAGPDQTISKEILLERLSVAALQSQATSRLAKRAHDDVLKLCRYIFEADKSNATAHKLEAMVYLERGDFVKASRSQACEREVRARKRS